MPGLSILKPTSSVRPLTVIAGREAAPRLIDIAIAARRRASLDSQGYALANAPTSPYENLSGNRIPGVTRPRWLRGHYKCNQFVGDALTEAGYRMPTFRMRDGSEHYMNAERLPAQRAYFDRIDSAVLIKSGDVLVLDGPARGENGAHVEVITAVNQLSGKIISTGAHRDGAYDTDRTNLFREVVRSPAEQLWRSGKYEIFVLRPKQLLDRK